MRINLEKGQRIVIGQTNVTLGLGWEANDKNGADFDLDCSAFMLANDGKLVADEYFVFYNNLESLDGALIHSEDDLTGGDHVGDDNETISVDVTKLNPKVTEILFIVSIFKAKERHQNFGQVRNSYVRIIDNNTNQEIAKYELNEDFSIETCVEFGRLYKHNNEWKFEAIGVGQREDLQYYVDKYVRN